MLIAIGASNRLPEDEALQALFDRFLLRVHCGNVETDRLGEVLDAGRARERNTESASSLSVAAIRTLQTAILDVDLSLARPALIEIIKQLRQAGMSISDRRAVRLQRVIAASAVVSGRTLALASDLWPLRMIWDAPAQIEMLQSHVQNVIEKFAKKEPHEDVREHPLANPDRGPDPELLNRSLEALAQAIGSTNVADSLSLLAARVEWVQNDSARDHLRQKVNDLRTTITTPK
jgi:MoxR-like ATPase